MKRYNGSKPITLPRWLSGAAPSTQLGTPSLEVVVTAPKKKKRVYVTQSQGTQWEPGIVAVAMAWCLREHDSADELRKLARRLADVALMEHRPNLMLMWRAKDDAAVFSIAIKIINRVCEMWDIAPDQPFERNPPPPPPVEAPRCHMTPMKKIGSHHGRRWKCRHCSHTKPIEAAV